MLDSLKNSGLLERDLIEILKAIQKFPEIEQVILFGSRAKGTYKNGSDVDLAIKGQDLDYDTPIHLSTVLNEEMALPYYFDVVDYQSITEQRLIEHIDRVGVIVFERSS
jgi:uncharacterized protein